MKRVHDRPDIPAWFRPHAAIRTDGYVLLGALLTGPPPEQAIGTVRDLQWQADLPASMQRALDALCRVAERSAPDSVADEYNRIFVGLGSGDLVPYGSWYLEKSIQSTPLARIRRDLGRLGLMRQSASCESEDHAGALCEIMALLSHPDMAVALKRQALFFQDHMGSWMARFFRDLQAVEDAVFYPALGEFGHCFINIEEEYLRQLPDARGRDR